MAISIHRETAKIYQFPVRPRRRLEDGRTVASGQPEVVVSVVDDCWYHNDAVHEDKQQTEWPKPC